MSKVRAGTNLGQKRRLDAGPGRRGTAIESVVNLGSQRRPAQAHLRSPSIWAQARATDELATSLPGSVAQPPFSTKEVCCQELTFFSSTRFASAPAARRNLSTQMGASAAMTAELALFSANSLAVLPSVHPPKPKPMTTVARKPMNAPDRKSVV